MTNLDLAESRLNGLDRIHKTGRFYDNQSRDKQAAKLAFAAYDEAVRSGDSVLAEAARQRFLAASARLKGGRG